VFLPLTVVHVHRGGRAPDLLTVHLKRFHQDVRGRLQKIDGGVPFDFDLDLSTFCDPEGPEKDGLR
jgi:ubiquitin carboxyl-terminal hydrolase 16/45